MRGRRKRKGKNKKKKKEKQKGDKYLKKEVEKTTKKTKWKHDETH